jgi:hypothetical protein
MQVCALSVVLRSHYFGSYVPRGTSANFFTRLPNVRQMYVKDLSTQYTHIGILYRHNRHTHDVCLLCALVLVVCSPHAWRVFGVIAYAHRNGLKEHYKRCETCVFVPHCCCKGTATFFNMQIFCTLFFKKNKTFFQVTENQGLARIDETKKNSTIFESCKALFANILKISTLGNFTKYICIVCVCM